jgi:hypothetical protein
MQSDIRKATISIAPLLKKSVVMEKPQKCAPNWRINAKNFFRKSLRHRCEPGAVNFSAGWLGQGHTVSFNLFFITIANPLFIQTEQYAILPSLNLRTQVYLGSSQWLRISNNVERFVNLTLSLINPDLFRSGLSMLRKLRDLKETAEIASIWQSVYTGIAIISNRHTRSHRDSKGRPEWFDTLLSFSAADTKPRLLLNDIDLDLEYSSGTVVSFCGTILEHEVRSGGIGDRICFAHFMRESVRKRLGVPPAGWVERKSYLKLASDGNCDDMVVDS